MSDLLGAERVFRAQGLHRAHQDALARVSPVRQDVQQPAQSEPAHETRAQHSAAQVPGVRQGFHHQAEADGAQQQALGTHPLHLQGAFRNLRREIEFDREMEFSGLRKRLPQVQQPDSAQRLAALEKT